MHILNYTDFPFFSTPFGISSITHIVGQSTTDPKGELGATVNNHDNWSVGDIVFYNSKEYILSAIPNSAENWIEIGDENAVTDKINALDSSVSATAADSNQYSVLTGVTQTDGKLSGKTEVKLSAIAKTGNVNDLVQTSGDYIILNCNAALGLE